MHIDAFDFQLPEELIALEAAEPRDSARLLSVDTQGQILDRRVADLPKLLRRGDLLILNNTKVSPVQLVGKRSAREEGGGGAVSIDVTLHQQLEHGSFDRVEWLAFARPAKRLKEGDILDFGNGFAATVVDRNGAEVQLRFDVDQGTFRHKLSETGAPPLPPYIARRRETTDLDRDRYQTVYAEHEGSVAAPTAGLHFTDDLFQQLDDGGIDRAFVTLHVGPGTYLPVTTDAIEEHTMHAEWGDVSEATVDRITKTKADGGRVISVGTTSMRLLETAARSGDLKPFKGDTDIYITPGFDFRVADLLMTNFHLPKSTLIMLVAAFIGLDTTHAVYRHAIEQKYRFYSYGDACLFERSQ
ncbi:MAG: tRNA preQ1(34) S-adenosylmethionine ribosyltransferase-isomerase QueA [Pseudomonadota bacterium]